MEFAVEGMDGVREILERKKAELLQVLQRRDGIAIERSADQMDEIQYAAGRDLAIWDVDRVTALLRQVNAALQRVDDGSFGICAECESPIGAKRIAAVPWAQCCIKCQESADREGVEIAGPSAVTLTRAA